MPHRDAWQPIETAPKDREVLVWAHGARYTAVFHAGSSYLPAGWYGSSDGTPYFEDDGSMGEYEPSRLMLEPTRWMPLPEPPDAEETR